MGKKQKTRKKASLFRKIINLLLDNRKARPDQANFLLRFLAFTIDLIIITFITLAIYGTYSEVSAARRGEKGIFSRAVQAAKTGDSFLITTKHLDEDHTSFERLFKEFLKTRLSAEEYSQAKDLSLEELKATYPAELEELNVNVIVTDEWLNLFYEIIIGYIYFTLFFRFGGRTPGKRFLRLKVVDLKGKRRLGWYQSFERAHGYTASALISSFGFLQVLWDKEGLTMHDKIASTTVIRLPKKRKPVEIKSTPPQNETGGRP